MSLTIPDKSEVLPLISLALQEDIGRGDVTSARLIPAGATAVIRLNAREAMVACGGFIAPLVYGELDSSVNVELRVREGQLVPKGETLAVIAGPARTLLAGERVTLNLMQRMCGVASLTSRFVQAVKGTGAIILDTRKTQPGFRVLDKYAVRAGGGQNHRMRLDDMVLIKDNHIALCGSVVAAIARAREGEKLPVVVECDTLKQVEEALKSKPDRIMLDNMTIAELQKAVTMAAGNVPLEASGGVTLENVQTIARTGVSYISVGALTHSARAADIGADIELKT